MGKREKARRRGLVAITLFAAAVAIAGTVGATWLASVAQERLAAERRTTDTLLAEQLEYADVTRLQARLIAVDDVRASVANVDIDWRSELQPYIRVVGDEGSVRALDVQGNVPFGSPLTLQGPLRTPRSATVILTVVTTAEPEPWRWLRAWSEINTFADASVDSVTFEDGEGFITVLTINLTADALSERATVEGDSE